MRPGSDPGEASEALAENLKAGNRKADSDSPSRLHRTVTGITVANHDPAGVGDGRSRLLPGLVRGHWYDGLGRGQSPAVAAAGRPVAGVTGLRGLQVCGDIITDSQGRQWSPAGHTVPAFQSSEPTLSNLSEDTFGSLNY